MSLDKIQLPDFLIADFFPNSLVITDESKRIRTPQGMAEPIATVPVEKESTEPAKPIYLGGNKKNISIVVKDTDAVYLRDEWLQLLTSILGACKLNIDDVAIINHSRTPVHYPDLSDATAPRFLLLFDVESKDIALPFSIPHYQVQGFNNCTFLLCPSLSLMIGSTETVKAEKTRLWMSLKKMFNI